jgi:hypothetical protein
LVRHESDLLRRLSTMFGYLFDRLSLAANARTGKAIAIGSAVGWGYLVGGVFIPYANEVTTHTVTLTGFASTLLKIAAVPMALDAIYGRSLAFRDLESRVDVQAGSGKKWRWALAVQFWGVWAYWLFGARRLPPQGTFTASQAAVTALGPLRRARQRRGTGSRKGRS